jgi:Cu2+-exporting ATPase
VTQGFDEAELIRLAASAESAYEHPVAQALKSCAREKGLRLAKPKVGSEKYRVGLGLEARVEGHLVQVGRARWMKDQNLKIKPFKKCLARLRRDAASTLCIGVDKKVVGVVGYSDGTRPEAKALVGKLHAGGRRQIVLLSGDSPEVVERVSAELGIDEARGGMLPEEKAEYVRRRKSEGRVVAMIGDGINDAPAMALADVGISFSGSSEVAIEIADVMLMGGGLIRLTKAFALGDETMRRVRENLGVIIVPNSIAICLGALGVITPPLAAVINNGATLFAAIVATFPLLNSTGRPEAGEKHVKTAPLLPARAPPS